MTKRKEIARCRTALRLARKQRMLKDVKQKFDTLEVLHHRGNPASGPY